MALLAIRDLTHRFAGPPVLDGARLTLERGDRVCLFGRNGEGKSTLMRIIGGRLRPDGGAADLESGATIGALEQEVPQGYAGTVFDVVIGGLGDTSDRLRAYHAAVTAVASDPSPAHVARLERAQAALEAAGGWHIDERVETAITRLGLDGDAVFETLSGGMRRRAFLAAALVQRPDVLLLDEPTNHLDVDAIEWLEEELRRYEGALLFVTHDRAFLRAVATRLVELDRGKLREFPADFDAYLEAKAHELEVEATHDALFDKHLAAEERWIRTGIKARRTRNEGRVRALERLREERRQRRERRGPARITVQAGDVSGADVIVARQVSFAFDPTTPLVKDLDLTLRRGDRLGLIGPNGVGKTTLLRLLLGELQPQSGTVTHGTRLQIGSYDQLRAALDPTKTLAEIIVEKGDTVEIDGRRRHVVGYLRDFAFDDAQVFGSVSVLSGGERNRLLLARLFATPANVLVLDEPTNDLDIETLELLEQRLLEFPGTVLVVSHDREFLDNVVTESLVFDGGTITRVVGGFADWVALRSSRRAAEAEARREEAGRRKAAEPRAQKGPRRSRDQQRELDALPARIEALEAEQAALEGTLGDEAVYRDPARLTATRSAIETLRATIGEAYARWEALESG
ncbi:MAG: ATP-binding cassette domain-containing protein [Myxococcales bacterium]|nr:ATP-binding cassette domain-containing protein [Myxococcales bacterium]MCB9534553.1 ATP-binding cassette domain-containing protein [Myxococcales bacterium]